MDAEKVSRGFALPTVLIASVIMLTVIVAAASAVSNVRVGLDSQYYNSLANDAAEAGVVYATACIKNNGGLSNWGPGGLTANTNCSGVAQDPNVQSPYVLGSNATYRTSFTVGQAQNTGAGVYVATVTGKVEFLRPNGVVWKTVTKTTNMQTGGQIGTTKVAFGYEGTAGAFFGAVGGDGKLRTVGYNVYGQLGNGTQTDSVSPVSFNITGTSSPVVRAYANFTSMGRNMFAIAADGSAWVTGDNDAGEAGIGSMSPTNIVNPTKVAMPAGVSVVSIATARHVNFFLGGNNKIYAAGRCDAGTLGTGYTISGCTNLSTPTPVALPAATDPNTIPTSQIVSDRNTTFVVMQGGALYGWGGNDMGQLGNGDNAFSDRSTPVRIGTYGNTGQPGVKQVLIDGDTTYILDTNGVVVSSGLSTYGEMGQGSAGMSLWLKDGNGAHCLDDNQTSSASTIPLWFYSCNGSSPQKFSLRSNGTIVSFDGRCVDTGGGSGSNGQQIYLKTCTSNNIYQTFAWEPNTSGYWYGRIRNPTSGRCIDNKSNNGTDVQLWDCNWSDAQNFVLNSNTFVPLETSGFSGTVAQIATDQWYLTLRTSNGEVYNVGVNNRGQFGNGQSGTSYFYNSRANSSTRFPIPDAGVTATDIYQTGYGTGNQNVLVIGSNGKVYGAGSNSSGQLGLGNTNSPVTTPTAMQTINGTTIAASQVQIGYGTTVIFTKAGSLYTVGNNGNGQLGLGDTADRSIPQKASVINDLLTRYY